MRDAGQVADEAVPSATDGLAVEFVDLGEIEPARSRHAGRRSAVAIADDQIVAGTATGEVVAVDSTTREEQWRAGPIEAGGSPAGESADGETPTGPASVVAAEPFGDVIVVGERSAEGRVRCYDAATGALRWVYATADDVGEPQKETRFFLPFVADVVVAGERCYVAARRYERDGDRRSFRSAVYAFERDGKLGWTYETDASPIGLAVDADDASPAAGAVAVAYNRCPGDHQHGLVVLDAESGDIEATWDPGTDGQRRVGDVAFVDDHDERDGLAVASHGDYRGYLLDRNGAERWRTDLATPRTAGGEMLYAYPNHVHASEDGIVIVTGNTYAQEGRETESLHPAEHTAFGYALDGEQVWSADVGGFAGGIGADGRWVAIPGAQHFRTRDADVHGLRVFDAERGPLGSVTTAGIVAAAAVEGGTVAAIEEPVVYHDEGEERGSYRLLIGGVDAEA